MTSPFYALMASIAGMGVAVALVSSLLAERLGRQGSLLAGALVAGLVALVALVPANLWGGTVFHLENQRKASAGKIERVAREQCFNDLSRPEVAPFVAFAREKVPADARFWWSGDRRLLPCVTLNMLPARPAVERDDSRDWTLVDSASPAVRRALTLDELKPEAERSYLRFSDTQVLARPGTEVPR